MNEKEMQNKVMESIPGHTYFWDRPADRYKNIVWFVINSDSGLYSWTICDIHGELTQSKDTGGLAVSRDSMEIKEDLAEYLT